MGHPSPRALLLPIVPDATCDRVVAWRGGVAVSRLALLHDALALARHLPERSFVVNACADRYRFLVAFAAALIRQQHVLLPNDRSRRVLGRLREAHPGLYALVDDPPERTLSEVLDCHIVTADGRDAPWDPGESPAIPAGAVVVTVYTSGSTGDPTPNPKRWDALWGHAALVTEYMGARIDTNLVATVPPQHMYGLETTILSPLLEGTAISTGRPLLGPEIADALSALPAPRILVTTPYHLRVLARSRPHMPPLEAIMSATAPLSAALAARLESMLGAPVLEIFGFTEAGAIATRRTVDGPLWRCRADLRLRATRAGHVVEAPHLDGPVPLSDRIALRSPQTFELRGRPTDMVTVAGKRASLPGLNSILTEIDGVIDGAFFQPPSDEIEGVSRLTAFVVAPGVSDRELRDALRAHLDPAFLPRRIVRVAELPRGAAGKLTREALHRLARAHRIEGR